MSIFSLKIYIFGLEICILRLEIWIFPKKFVFFTAGLLKNIGVKQFFF